MNAEQLLAAAVDVSRDIGHMFSFVLTSDDEPGVLIHTFLEGSTPPDDVFAGRECGALGVRVGWSPDQRPLRTCWAITSVSRGEPAAAAVGPHEGQWYKIPTLDLPWFMASTAGAIRAAIETGEPLVFKQAEDPSLMDRVQDSLSTGKVPPTDEHGRI